MLPDGYHYEYPDGGIGRLDILNEDELLLCITDAPVARCTCGYCGTRHIGRKRATLRWWHEHDCATTYAAAA